MRANSCVSRCASSARRALHICAHPSSEPDPTADKAVIYNCNTGFIFANTGLDNSLNIPEQLFDLITDGVDLYLSRSVDDATALNHIVKITVPGGVVTSVDMTANLGTKSNINLTSRDGNTIWATYVINSATEFVIRQAVINKSPLSFSGLNSIGTINKSNTSLTYNARITATAYSDFLAMFAIFERIEATARTFGYICHMRNGGMTVAVMTVGATGKGKPFLMGSSWYVPVKLGLGDRMLTVLLREGVIGVDRTISPSVVTLPGQTSEFITTFTRPPNDAFNETFVDDNVYYFSSESSNGSAILGVSVDTRQENGAIEIDGSLITYGSITGYFDGIIYTEMGFIGQPYISALATVAGGSLTADTYQAVAIFTWTDSKGDVHRSSESNTITVTVAASGKILLTINHPLITKKENVYVEIYIRKVNQFFQLSTSYLLTSSNMYSQAVEITSYPSTGSIFLYTEPTTRENVTPINAKCMSIYGDRVFYISHDDKNMIRYTKQKKKGIGLEFVEDFRMVVLDKAGYIEDEIYATFPMDGKLIIFKGKSILYTYGTGPADDGSKNDFIEPQLISSDVGCISQRSIVLTPDGIMFMSQKGIYLISRGLELLYIGSPVERYNSQTITSAILVDLINEIRFTSLEGVTVVYNYFSKQWSWVTDMPTKSSTIYQNKHTSIRNFLIVYDDSTTFKLLDNFVTQKIGSPWVRLKKLQGYQKAYKLLIAGLYKTKHKMKVDIYYDYELYVSESYEINPLSESQYNIVTRPTNAEIESGSKTNGVYQLSIDLIRKNCEAIKVVITDIGEDLSNNNGECFALTNLTFTVGVKNGTYKLPASKTY